MVKTFNFMKYLLNGLLAYMSNKNARPGTDVVNEKGGNFVW